MSPWIHLRIVMVVDRISVTIVALGVALFCYNVLVVLKFYILTDCSVVSMVNRDAIKPTVVIMLARKLFKLVIEIHHCRWLPQSDQLGMLNPKKCNLH